MSMGSQDTVKGGTGNEIANTLVGNGAEDTLDGGAGAKNQTGVEDNDC